MEARYLTNEEGERVGVFVDMDEYEAVEKERAEIRRRLEENEALILQILETARRLSGDDYEQFLALIREGSIARGLTPEQIEERLENLEDYEALMASTDDAAELEGDSEQTTPLRTALERVEAEREALRRRGEL